MPARKFTKASAKKAAKKSSKKGSRKAARRRSRSKLDFAEIKTWGEFEDLVEDYFKEAKKEEKSIIDVEVKPTGVGSDGGRDILVTFRITDSIVSFTRKWVVQCKFYSGAVSKANLSTVNIPTLIHEYGADGYLLVCKNDVTSKVSEMFENLERECKLGYCYAIWRGNELTRRIQFKPSLIERYFPEHYEFLRRRAK
jgi:hypothetical protein